VPQLTCPIVIVMRNVGHPKKLYGSLVERREGHVNNLCLCVGGMHDVFVF
jgi:hypothetical protein